VSWSAAIALAFKGLHRRPGRSMLTVLAVLLAAALLTALLTIATTAETRVLDELAKGGPLAGIKVAATAPDPEQVGQDEAIGSKLHTIDDAALTRIQELPAVREAIPVVVTRVLVAPPPSLARLRPSSEGRQPDTYVETVVGVDIKRSPSLPITVLNGRLPAAGALDQIAISESALPSLGIARADATKLVGSVIQLGAPQTIQMSERTRTRVRWARVTVVGIVAQEAADGGILAPVELVSEARDWSLAGLDDVRYGIPRTTYAGVYVVAHSLDDVGAARQQIAIVGYSTSAPENLIASVRRYLHVVEIVLTAIGAIALTVAALGIANAMLAAVRERRREIGVIKAIGGRDRDVRRMFLVEAAVLGFAGGLLGALGGFIVARYVGTIVNSYLVEQGLKGIELTVPVGTMSATVVGATVLAVLAGTAPALGAARLPAREALGAV
jgi:ABC-type antimicrobial peptide transport system permease subunit